MTVAPILQCARVDNFPRTRTRDPLLPNISEGSTSAACARCRAQVWVSPPAREVLMRQEAVAVCEVCQPAGYVSVTSEE